MPLTEFQKKALELRGNSREFIDKVDAEWDSVFGERAAQQVITGKGTLVGMDYDITRDIDCVVIRLPRNLQYFTPSDARWLADMLNATADAIDPEG